MQGPGGQCRRRWGLNPMQAYWCLSSINDVNRVEQEYEPMRSGAAPATTGLVITHVIRNTWLRAYQLGPLRFLDEHKTSLPGLHFLRFKECAATRRRHGRLKGSSGVKPKFTALRFHLFSRQIARSRTPSSRYASALLTRCICYFLFGSDWLVDALSYYWAAVAELDA